MFFFAKVRVARPANQLSKVIQFYTEGLKLPQLSYFTNHARSSGVMVGLPDREYHLEFTQHEELVLRFLRLAKTKIIYSFLYS